ncbi:hypothetical protein [Hymenobacter metallicola]|uniref:Uncharacterized protein n=1 Tax=Hymenobacter metallicola TaxID=2563114 RepID=A0A4Z0Q1X6_9BACT|nr:hypothetical protein [Hymenobacter metallicola]TGE23516.1 hypothetical protein E5K02_20225 [Hymenobacter metallicola]
MVVLLYQLFGILSGAIEAVLYSRRGAEAFTRNEHAEMVLQRIVVASLPLAGVLLYQWSGSALYVGFELVPAALLFPLCHDEAYNFTRLWITYKWGKDGREYADWAAWELAWTEYQYGYQSPTTTARNDFNGKQRTWLGVAALVLWGVGAWLIL